MAVFAKRESAGRRVPALPPVKCADGRQHWLASFDICKKHYLSVSLLYAVFYPNTILLLHYGYSYTRFCRHY